MRSTLLSATSVVWAASGTPHPTEEAVRREYDRTWSLLGGREIEELIDLPLMSKPESAAAVEVMDKAMPPAHVYGQESVSPAPLADSQFQPGTRQHRCVLLCLRSWWRPCRSAFWKLQGRISVRPAWLRPGRAAWAEKVQGPDPHRVRRLHRVLDQTLAYGPRIDPSGVRCRKYHWRCHVGVIFVAQLDRELSRGRRSARRSASAKPSEAWRLRGKSDSVS